ncbi:MAG: FYVE zinc finger domain-containing protein [Promethearchaeia archaeon]
MTKSENVMDTIHDRPFGLRLIGLTQMGFGILGLLATAGLLTATVTRAIDLGSMGLIYSLIILAGVAIPCLVIGNYVDDLRRWAVFAQIGYSIFAVMVAGFFLYIRGMNYIWTFPWFGYQFSVRIGNLALLIVGLELAVVLYLLARWEQVVPPPGAVIERDRGRAALIEDGLIPSPLETKMLGPDGSQLSEEKAKEIMDVRRISTKEGMAILCSNCGGATSLTEMRGDNTVECSYCGISLAVSGVFVPCENHPEYLAAAKCAVCGNHFCRRCLTSQEPPVDERWHGSNVYLCQNCFEGRYQPAVTTTSLVLPIDELFDQAGGRFSKVGVLYRKFLGKYAAAMKYVLAGSMRIAQSTMRSARGRNKDNAAAFLIMMLVIIVAIPVLVGALLLLGALVIVPALFYAGLIGVAYEAYKIIRHTDFVSLAEAREQELTEDRPAKQESKLRDTTRPWEQQVAGRRRANGRG